MPDASDSLEVLTREGRVLGRYLAGARPPDHVLGRYAEAHARRPELEVEGEPGLDRFLVRLARRGTLAARTADVFAARAAKAGSLRKKLVLMVALLECSPESHSRIDRPRREGRVRAWIGLTATALLEGLTLLAAALLVPVGYGLAALLGRGGRR
jgi:hypothetical protein